MILRRIVLSLAVGLAAPLLLGACGSSNGDGSDSAAPVTPAASDSAVSAPATSAAADSGGSGTGSSALTTGVAAEALNGVGTVVADDKGMTLYRYDKDESDPSKWTCSGACTKTWLPVIVGDSVQTSGVEKNLLGTVHRNGMKQLTLAGWPLYRYSGDTGAEQANGQGKDAQWYAVAPSGQKAAQTG
ncbi:hypothetical protein ABZ642_09800 [Streptomyces sp. NPDC007157]|uniref:hypothetical protein n=1 Tax=Streptomyces sp. NPDC007157 TaxID=3154681 RepID=UPI003407E382